MKKLLVLLFSLLLLVSCSGNSYSSLSDGDTVLFTGPNNTSYTKNDLYKSLKVSSQDAIVSDILKNIALSYDVDMETIEADAQTYLDEYTQNGYESYIISMYGSLEAFKQSYIAAMLQQELAKVYVNENFDTIIENDAPVKMQIASFKSLDEANACLEAINGGTTFDTAALNNNSQSSPLSQVYVDTDSSLAFEVKEYLNTTDTLGLSSIITSTTTSTDADGNQVDDNTYYILNIESRDVEQFKDEYIDLAAGQLDSEVLNQYMFEKHKIEFFDQDLYELVSKEYEVLK